MPVTDSRVIGKTNICQIMQISIPWVNLKNIYINKIHWHFTRKQIICLKFMGAAKFDSSISVKLRPLSEKKS